MPEVGLSGNDIAKLWLARVGAVNNINQQAADQRAASQIATGQIINSGIGSLTSMGGMMGGLGGGAGAAPMTFGQAAAAGGYQG